MRSERRTPLGADPDVVWRALEQVDRYRAWWPWLRAFDGRSLATGQRWSCSVQPPLPYRVRFTIDLVEVVAASHVRATVGGDVAGVARLDLVPTATGTDLLLTAELSAANRWLRHVERWAHPVARFGHDRIIDRALGQLAHRVDGPGDGPGRPSPGRS